MRRSIVVSCFCIILLASTVVSAVSYPKSPSLPGGPLDSYGNICWEDEKSRLDNLAIAVQDAEGWYGYIVIYAGRRSCVGEAQARLERARKWVVEKRGIEANRIILKDGGYRENVRTELWLVPYELSESEWPLSPTLGPHEVEVIAGCEGKIYKPAKCLNP
jgi:hypothetical protein